MATERQREEWVKAELAPGEKIAWIGFPDSRAFMADYPIQTVDFWCAFGSLVVWIGFLIAGAFVVLSRDVWVVLAVLSSVFFGAAVSYFMGRRFFASYAQAERTVYALTDRRGLILQGKGKGKNPDARSLSAEDLSRIEWQERTNAAGINGIEADSHDLVFPHLTTSKGEKVGFLAVPDSRAVERRIRGLLVTARN